MCDFVQVDVRECVCVKFYSVHHRQVDIIWCVSFFFHHERLVVLIFYSEDTMKRLREMKESRAKLEKKMQERDATSKHSAEQVRTLKKKLAAAEQALNSAKQKHGKWNSLVPSLLLCSVGLGS